MVGKIQENIPMEVINDYLEMQGLIRDSQYFIKDIFHQPNLVEFFEVT